MNKHVLRYISVLLPILVLSQSATWDIIQSEILLPNCVVCHDHGTYFTEQSGLNLAPDVAYEGLINQVPTNTAAADDGLTLVGNEGIPSLYSSFLWEKINAQDQEHFYSDHPEYGALMPLGMDFLTNGQLEYIREWIISGAPDAGVVADSALLEDTTVYTLPEFEPLDPPENGIQLHLGPFAIPPQFEREIWSFTELDTTGILYINNIEILMAQGSHHYIAYTYNQIPPIGLPPAGVYRDIRDENGEYNPETFSHMAYQHFVTGSQYQVYNYHLPAGVALRLDSQYGIDQNSHYINYTNDTTYGEAYANLHMVPLSELEHVAEILQLGETDLELPPQQVTTVNKIVWIDNEFGEPITIIQLMSHAHLHNESFSVYRRNQNDPSVRELIYLALDWEHPPIHQYDPPLEFGMDEGIEMEAVYNNDTDEMIGFGFLSTDEMMFLFGIYHTSETVGMDGSDRDLPYEFSVSAPYPNPFNPSTKIEYSLPEGNSVNITVYDLMGNKIRTLIDEYQAEGTWSVKWDSKNRSGISVAAGIYFFNIRTGQSYDTKKAVLLK